MKSSRGFTLIEIVVAMLVLTVGVLGAAHTLALATRMVTEGRVLTSVAAIAAARLETIRGSGCQSIPAGHHAGDSAAVAWSVVPIPGGRRATVTVTRPGPRGPRVNAISTVLLCPG